MKKFFIAFFLITVSCFLYASTLSVGLGKGYNSYPGVDYVVFFNGIDAATNFIKYDSIADEVKWCKYDGSVKATGTDTFYDLEDSNGYYLEEKNGHRITFWVIDYSLHNTLGVDVDPNQTDRCNNVSLICNVPTLDYYTFPANMKKNIKRDFSVKYTTLKWKVDRYNDLDTFKTFTFPETNVVIPVPLRNTTFKLEGDQFALDLGIASITALSAEYTPDAVDCKITTFVTSREREKNNEASAPSDASPISFSAPFDVQFIGNANEPIAKFYKWEIFKNNTLIITRNVKDHLYTFTEAGNYLAKLFASNGNNSCTKIDSINIDVNISELHVPNVFTPNGDGYNDEFRVAYKSIIKFDAWVYNRWGRLVYHWTDPTKGWDGNINGRKATVGPYTYIIKAYGSDFDENSKPNKYTKERIGEFIRKGDINLLRGKD